MTEFLPVSSSGHLVILQKILGMSGAGLAISVVLHLGTLLAIVVFFFKDILALMGNRKTLFLVLVSVAITGTIGLLGKGFFERLFSSAEYVGVAWVFTGAVLILAQKLSRPERQSINLKDAFVLGLAQSLAIIPGISRSGMTISSLLFRKVEPVPAFTFSFLVSIPVILGAALLEAKDIQLLSTGGSPGNLAVGFCFSFFTGLAAIFLLRSALKKAKLHYFGYYCILMAVFTLVFLR